MKRKDWIAILLVISLLLAGCAGKESELTPSGGIVQSGVSTEGNGETNAGDNEGSQGNGNAEDGTETVPKEYETSYWKYDLELTSEEMAFFVEEGENFLSAQYYQGEGICFYGNEEGQLFCYHAADGEEELLLEGVPEEYLTASNEWYRDSENFYVSQKEVLIVLDINGQQVYRLDAGGAIGEICGTKNGDIALLVSDMQGSGYMVLTLDKETRVLTNRVAVQDYLAVSEGYEADILVMTWQGVYDLNLENGDKVWHMKWAGTSYMTGAEQKFPCAFILSEEGKLEQLQSDRDGKFFAESLCKINPEATGKILLTYRTSMAMAEEKLLIAQFNKDNDKYYVVLEEGGDRERTSMEIATGQGPDMISPSAVQSISSLAEKGALENLEPYFQASGLSVDNYFPAAVSNLGMETGIYAIGSRMFFDVFYIRKDFVEDVQNTNLEEILDNMEAYEGNAVLSSTFGYGPSTVLWFFLHVSDDLFGMVDWENKTCDFSGELWEQLLRVSGRYGVTERNKGDEEIASMFFSVRSLYEFAKMESEAHSRGMVAVGYPSDEGMVSRISAETIAINASSQNKEGAWAFIQYLLSEKVQRQIAENAFPVDKKIFQESVDNVDKEMVYGYDSYTAGEIYITDESIADCLAWIERGKIVPIHTGYILGIVEEESEFYFMGDKSIEEISDTIENRVRLYLMEMD
ncbi:MAG: extracellular solute-binding protein [Lachnospiraceae bacterium]|nr:extracellular solute-binding protein [Lachnospiraceae bacterium]